jgi:hypothetical protein
VAVRKALLRFMMPPTLRLNGDAGVATPGEERIINAQTICFNVTFFNRLIGRAGGWRFWGDPQIYTDCRLKPA